MYLPINKNSMLKFFFFSLSFFATQQCFCQPAPNKDSLIKSTDIENATKNNHPSDVVTASLKIYPNPAKNKISLSVAGFEPGMALVKITDTKGKIWRQDNRLLTNGTEEMAMFLLLQPGIYFISVSEKNKLVKKKLVIL